MDGWVKFARVREAHDRWLEMGGEGVCIVTVGHEWRVD